MKDIIDALTGLCVAVIPSIVTIITSRAHTKTFEINAAKMDILQLILEDKVHMMNGEPPMNYQAILNEFDRYTANGGNSYIHDKVEEYKQLVNNKGTK